MSSPEALASFLVSDLVTLIAHKEKQCLRLGQSQEINCNFLQPHSLLGLLCCGLFFLAIYH